MVRRSNRKRNRPEEVVFAGWKILKKSKEHNGHNYSIGCNKDAKKFDPSGYCKEGGLYFASKNVLHFTFLYDICEVGTIHRVYTYPDSQVYHESKKSKTDKFWLGEGFDLSSTSTWEMMAANGVDVLIPSCEWAAEMGNLPVVEFLVKKSADENRKYKDRSLMVAAVNGHLSVVKFLVENGADVNIGGGFALREASRKGHFEMIKFLVENGADVNIGGGFALQEAIINNQFPVVKFLIENGANIHACNDYAVQEASRNGNLPMVKFLIENGANIHAYSDFALWEASERGHLPVVKFLVENGANVSANENSALRCASNMGRTNVVKFLESQLVTTLKPII
jgi:ankyrin repeat protein